MTLFLTDIDDVRVYYIGPRGPASQTWAVLRALGEPHWRHLLDAASGAAVCATNAAAFWHGGRPTAEGAAHATMDARARAEQMGLDAVAQQVAGQRALAILYPFIPTPEQVRGAREHLTPAQVYACEQAARATMHTLSATERAALLALPDWYDFDFDMRRALDGVTEIPMMTCMEAAERGVGLIYREVCDGVPSSTIAVHTSLDSHYRVRRRTVAVS